MSDLCLDQPTDNHKVVETSIYETGASEISISSSDKREMLLQKKTSQMSTSSAESSELLKTASAQNQNKSSHFEACCKMYALQSAKRPR